MKCIAVGNKKGGVGKTTIALNLACELAIRNKSVILFDLDEQKTATDWCSRGNLPIEFKPNPVENRQNAEEMIRLVKHSTADIVVLDLPPHTHEATEAALIICDLFLIPVTPSGADFVATSKAIELMKESRSVRNGAPLSLLVPSRVDRRTAFGKEIVEALAGFNEPVGPGISQRSAYVDCFGLGDWIGGAYTKSSAYEEIKILSDRVEELLYGTK